MVQKINSTLLAPSNKFSLRKGLFTGIIGATKSYIYNPWDVESCDISSLSKRINLSILSLGIATPAIIALISFHKKNIRGTITVHRRSLPTTELDSI